MHLNADISNALQQIEAIKKAVDDLDDPKLQLNTTDDLKLILDILQDPVFRSIVQVQDSLSELNNQIAQHPSILPGDFDITTSGDLVLTVPPSLDLYDQDYQDEQRVPSAQLSPRSPTSPLQQPVTNYNVLGGPSSLNDSDQVLGSSLDNQSLESHQQSLSLIKKSRGYVEANVARSLSGDEERPQSAISDTPKQSSDLMSSEWAQIQAIELVNDGTGLGFGIIGARTSGVIVKTILPGGVADRDSRLQSGDHILQIGDVNLHDMVSEQVASVLRQSGTHVRLVVARSIDPLRVSTDIEGTAIVPTRLLSDPIELERYLIAAGYPDIFGIRMSPSSPSSNQKLKYQVEQKAKEVLAINNRAPISPPIDIELPETEKFTIELTKDLNGLGITIAGYVCEKEELSGIFVKSVSPGSAADLSGRINVNDRIIEVDGQSLQGYSNHQAVEVLKKSGTVVTLCLERYLRGPKYEQLQQAIAANELKPSTPGTPPSHLISSGTSRSHNITQAHSMPHEHIRKASLTKYTGNNGESLNDVSPHTMSLERNEKKQHIINDQDVVLLDKPIFPPKKKHSIDNSPPVATVHGISNTTINASNRKLAHARDSIENKLGTDNRIETTATSLIVPIHNVNNLNNLGDDFSIESTIDDIDDEILNGVGGVNNINTVAFNQIDLLKQQQQQQRKISLIETTNMQAINRHKYFVEPELTNETELVIKKKWKNILGTDADIIVAQIRKFAASSGLGISLEGTVDVECGREVRPHHYIRSILPEGPVGQNGLLHSGDELLEVNGQRLLGMNHLEVVSILKELPQDVRMICARGPVEMVAFTEENVRNNLNIQFGGSQNLENLLLASDRLVKAKSDGSLATSGGTADDGFTKLKSRSLEPLTGLAMWSSEPQIIELLKGERGLGFSILDYQDPLDPNDTLIVIRSLVPGGVAQIDGRLIPGDRLLFVNDINLENASLDQAVQALKGAPKGVVRIGVAKPLPMADTSINNDGDLNNKNDIERNFSSLKNRNINNKPDILHDWQTK